MLIAVIVVFFIAYIAPTVVAFQRGRPDAWSIAALNFFLGWTIVGWILALNRALKRERPRLFIHVQNDGQVRYDSDS
ncbi:superinfection immunity protein [Polymorphobacter sp.]|uniref:superinfection immunity protein n=1 Tax=Polymorphobacter sp. TaxID=1909290 RepID=UPI003F72481C